MVRAHPDRANPRRSPPLSCRSGLLPGHPAGCGCQERFRDAHNQLDLSTLEICSGSYVSDDLRDRADDIVWRVRRGRDWLYLYLLLEFQSTIDRWMAVRIQTYLGLL